jgi:hypothetical protein
MAAAVVALLVAYAPAGAAGPCDTARIVQPTSNLQGAINASSTYCLRGGIYNEGDNQVAISASNVTVYNYPGERVDIRAQLKTQNGAPNFRMIGTDVAPDVEGLMINNTYGNVQKSSHSGQAHYTVQGNQIFGEQRHHPFD